jgi:2-C-methyl-D-erythritol 4-phosphate cytidylyltransferase
VVAADRPCEVLAPLLGEPVLARAVKGLLASAVVGEVVVLVRPELCGAAARLLVGLPVVVHVNPAAAAAAAIERARSDRAEVVLVHDAARALTPPALAKAVTQSVVAAAHRIAVPVLPLADTVKQVNSGGLVVGSPDRSGLRVVQTPQAFRADLLGCDLLQRLLASDGPVEHAWAVVGAPAVTVPGHPLAFAVRSAWERELAEVLAGETVTA